MSRLPPPSSPGLDQNFLRAVLVKAVKDRRSVTGLARRLEMSPRTIAFAVAGSRRIGTRLRRRLRDYVRDEMKDLDLVARIAP